MNDFFNLFKNIRRNKKITQNILSKRTGLSQTFFVKIEKHNTVPNCENFVKICEGLSIDYIELKTLYLAYKKLIKPQQIANLINSYFPESNYIVSLLIKNTIFEEKFNKLYKQVNDNVKPIINDSFIIKAVGYIAKALNENRTNPADYFDIFDIIKKKADILFKIDIKKLEDGDIKKINILKKTCQYYKILLGSDNNKNIEITLFDDKFKKNIPEFNKLTDTQKSKLSLILNKLFNDEWFGDEKNKCLFDSNFYLKYITSIHNFVFGSVDINQGHIIETKDNNYFIIKITPTFDESSILELISDDYNNLIDIKINQLKEIILSVKDSLNIQDKSNDNLILPHINSLISIFSLIKDLFIKKDIKELQKGIMSFGYKNTQKEFQNTIKQLKEENRELKQKIKELEKLLQKR